MFYSNAKRYPNHLFVYTSSTVIYFSSDGQYEVVFSYTELIKENLKKITFRELLDTEKTFKKNYKNKHFIDLLRQYLNAEANRVSQS